MAQDPGWPGVDCAEGLALRPHCCLGLVGFSGIPEGAYAEVAPAWRSTWTVLPTFPRGSVARERIWASEGIAAGEEPPV